MPRIKRPLGAWLAISLVVVASTWLGHTLEYLRLFGAGVVARQLVGSVHAYMVPLALVLEAATILLAAATFRLWRRLGLRFARAEAAIHLAWRGEVPDTSVPARHLSRIDPLALWLLLAPVELTLYVLQENFEAMRVGVAAPGLGVLIGIHWPALFVHLAILLILCLVLATVLSLLLDRTRVVEEVERIVRLIAGSRRRRQVPPSPVPVWRAAPIQLFGRHLWRRPPPALPLSA
jgi:hypothetical protein